MKKIILFILVCFLSSFIFGNDGLVVNYGGGIEPIEKTIISIYREDLIISFNEKNKNWHVSVSFVLFNPTNSDIENEIAFINYGFHELGYNGDIINFLTWINNEEKTYKYTKVEGEKNYEMGPVLYKEYFTSKICFTPGYTVIKHEYDFIGSVGWGPDRFGFSYTLTTANKWNGPIKYFNLSISLPKNSILLTDYDKEYSYFNTYGEVKKLTQNKMGTIFFRNGGFFYSKENFKPEKNIQLEIYDWTWYLKSIPIFKSEEYGQKDYDKPRISFYDLANKKLIKENLNKYTKEQIRVIRNSIYAMHGYFFNSSDLYDTFNNYIWYLPKTSFTESELSTIEKYNIVLLLEIEKSI